MIKEEAQKAAQDILDDRHGADYYRDMKILSEYLEGALGISKDKAEQTAKVIQEDRKGSNYYEQVETLSGFLMGSCPTYETIVLKRNADYLSPDGSEIRCLPVMKGGGICHCTLPAGKTSSAVKHKTVEEIWYFLEGKGEVWRLHNDHTKIVEVGPGISLTIPVGTHFQFRNTGSDPLRFVIATMPPWPGADEAVRVENHW
ncbi:MAG: cupin domain-containing protein [Pseudomonadota bacterium]